MNVTELPGLQIESPIITTSAENFRPSSWPPPIDFPVVTDAEGNVVSRYGDVRWDLSPWAGHTLTIHFGDGPGQGKKLSLENASLLRQIVAWWLWGAAAVRSARSLVYKFESIKPLFVACTDNGIVATDLYKFPRVIQDVASYYSARGNRLISYLNALSYAEDQLGFTLLNEKGMKIFSEALPNNEETQTAYIPVRIWNYQISRLRECIDDFIAHKDDIEDCYNFCLDAYAKNAGGSLATAFGGLGTNAPFNGARSIGLQRSGKVFYGKFRETARNYKIERLLEKWCNTENKMAPVTLSSYLSLVCQSGLAYILNLSLMRVEEAGKLRADCYEVEPDPLGNDIHLLKGITTKTIEDGDARWIVSSSVDIAVKAMEAVASMRMKAAIENPYIELSKEDIENPVLQSLPHEPWSPKAPLKQPIKKYKKARSYGDIWNIWPKLFDAKELTITDADLELANRLTDGLDPEKFALGKVWPLAWHQLRRTGAVNMLASGLVSEASLQYQLKHASRAMSQYYGKNYYRLKEPLNDEARGYYLREMYQAMVREFKSLQSDQYVSPHGEKRKDQILQEISEKDHKQLIKAAKAGRISYRQTFLGGCANSGPPCPLGGISNISSCMGFGEEKPCKSALLDKDKLPMINQLREVVSIQIIEAEEGSPMHESLQAQLESAERAINVIENC
ncbi:hypothetical protein DN730_18940 [Marinomonas piezotolerans]|uniref:Integrase n=1 Tax=Marinomonas piezotolerans TaxID=2213058 RepID=A0A370U479_9GAMM|nr:hypothetical protein [Marinomonas piezotolerans]RDL42576.1 hypothetical protein DN730_18940 [Marinomonas piezotolerans]